MSTCDPDLLCCGLAGSHRGSTVPRTASGQITEPESKYDQQLKELRAAAGMVGRPTLRDGPEDVQMPGEVYLELRPDQLLVRSTRIFHGTRLNVTKHARLMSHWGFKIWGDAVRGSSAAATARLRWEDHLTPAVLAALSPAQNQLLRIGMDVKMDPVFETERAREMGVRWGTLEELRMDSGAKQRQSLPAAAPSARL